jgi:hypothetical protein
MKGRRSKTFVKQLYDSLSDHNNGAQQLLPWNSKSVDAFQFLSGRRACADGSPATSPHSIPRANKTVEKVEDQHKPVQNILSPYVVPLSLLFFLVYLPFYLLIYNI